MTAPVCRVVAGERVPSKHPLAHRSGIQALHSMIVADRLWRPVSPAGKAALRRAYTRALAEAVADGAERVPLPALPDGVHPGTVRGLARRGLVDGAALTPLAVEVLRWALPLDDHRRQRPIDTIHPTGDAL